MDQIRLNRSQAGFTLVELAVVMIIIGLLIGGILKGQELISNAQVTATVSQVKGIDAAISTFRDMYNALPGDLRAPENRLPNCDTVGGCDTDGNGNGRIDGDVAGDPTGEMLTAWVHLSAADLITGVDPAGGEVWGGVYPEAEIGGGYHLAFDSSGDLGANAASRAGHYLVLTFVPDGAPDGTALTPTQAARIDRKIDDGIGTTGSVFDDENCSDDDGVYEEADPSLSCDLYLRIQG
jgi:prepilin-type N-terminal cleavage/methylation domain-containing protein